MVMSGGTVNLTIDLAPDWLRESWADAERNGTDQLSMDEIDAEIAAARKDRRDGE